MAEENKEPLGFLRGILDNPDAMQQALTLAAKLKESGALSGLLSAVGGESGEKATAAADGGATANAAPAAAEISDATEKAESSGTLSSLSGLSDLLPVFAAGRGDAPHHDSAESGRKSGASPFQSDRYKEHRMLLQALRPYLSAERKQRVDFLLKLLQLLELAGKLGLQNLFAGGISSEKAGSK